MNFLNTNIVLFLFAAGIVLYTASAESPNCQQIISTTDIRTSPLSCTFNNNTCGFALSRGWKRTSSYSYHSNTIRHGIENSQFVVFDRNLSSTTSPSISSPELKPGTYCLSLWTYTTNIAGTLQIKTSSGHTVKKIKGSINSGWKQHTATVNGTTPFKIEFQYVLSSFLSRYVTIGIDNILIVQTAGIGSNKTEISCTAGETNSTNGTCDFNSGRCGYTIQGHFENRTGLYSYAGNVIQQGHENSPYIVCNWDKFGVSNNNTLTSPMIEPGTYCLTFWYFVTGSSVGLSVFTTTGQSLFANISDPESTHVWTQVAVSVTEKRPFKVLFQMLRAKGFFTQLQTIGIDDIRVSSRREKVCTEIVPEGTCSFKNGKTCGFRLDPPRWKVNIGEFSMGRPVFLHGQDDDSYALFETFVHIDNEEEGQAYDLASPMLNPGQYCLSFWYSLPNHFSNISVITSDGVENNTIWSLEQSQKNWTEKSLQVDSRDKFQILFRSYRFSRHVGAFVGLDNIKLSKEPETRVVSSTQSLSSTLSSESPSSPSTASMSTPTRRTTEITQSIPPTSTIITQTTMPNTMRIKTTTNPTTKRTHKATTLTSSTSNATKKITTFSMTVKETYSTKSQESSTSSVLTKESTPPPTKTVASTSTTTTASTMSRRTSTVSPTETSTKEHTKPKTKTSTTTSNIKNDTHKTTKFPISASTTSTPKVPLTTSTSGMLTSLTSAGKKVTTKSTKKIRSTTAGLGTAITTTNKTTPMEIKSKTTSIKSTMIKKSSTRELVKTSTPFARTSASSKVTTTTNTPTTTTPLSIITTDTKQSSKVHTETTSPTPASSAVTMVSKTMKSSTVMLSTSQEPKTSQTSRTLSSTVPSAFSSTSHVVTTVSKTMIPLTTMLSTTKETKTMPTMTSISSVVTSTGSQTRRSNTSLPFMTTTTSQKSNATSTPTLNPSTTSIVNSSAFSSKSKTSKISASPFATASNTKFTFSKATSAMKVVSTKRTSALPFHHITSEITVNHSNFSSLTHFETTTISQPVNHSVTTEFPDHLESSVTTEKDTSTTNLITSTSKMFTANEDLSSSAVDVLTSTTEKTTGNGATSLSVSNVSSGKSTVPTDTTKSASSVTGTKNNITKTTSRVASSTDSTQVGQQSRQNSDGSKTGAIVGSVFGVLAAIGLVVVAVFLFLKFKSKRLTNSASVMDDDTEATFDQSNRNSNNLGLQPLGGQSLNQQYASIDMQPENGHTDNVRDSNRSFANIIYSYDNATA